MIKLPTKGGRTANRVSTALFSQSQINTKLLNQIPKNIICKNMCEVFCRYRMTVLDELIKTRPDLSQNIVREALTDLGIASDFLDGGKCDCDCKKI